MTAAAITVNDIDQIRKSNARTLAEAAGSLSAFADKIDRAPTQISRIIGRNATKGIGNRMARHIEETLHLEHGWLDQDHSGQADQPLPSQVSEAPTPYLLQQAISNRADILLLRDIIATIEEIIREEREELTPNQKAHAITACLEVALKQPEAERAPKAIAHTAIRAII